MEIPVSNNANAMATPGGHSHATSIAAEKPPLRAAAAAGADSKGKPAR